MISLGEEIHRRGAEQLAGRSARHINEQTVGFTIAQEAYKREALRTGAEAANFVASQKAA